MDPLSLMSSASSLFGMGIEAFGMMAARTAANNIHSEQNDILGQQESENELRRQAMVMSAQRQKTQVLRNAQIARAQGVASAVSQGANMGSGLATDSAASEGVFGVEGINRNMLLGNQIFDIDKQIGQDKFALGGSETDLSNAQGLMSFGASLAGSGQKTGQVATTGFGALNNLFAPNLGFS